MAPLISELSAVRHPCLLLEPRCSGLWTRFVICMLPDTVLACSGCVMCRVFVSAKVRLPLVHLLIAMQGCTCVPERCVWLGVALVSCSDVQTVAIMKQVGKKEKLLAAMLLHSVAVGLVLVGYITA